MVKINNNNKDTCVVTVPIGVFPSHKMMSAMVVFVHPEALKNILVNAINYKEHLVFSLYICPKDQLNDPLFALKLQCPFTYLHIHNGTRSDFSAVIQALAIQVKQLKPDIPDEELENLCLATAVKALEFSDFIAEKLRCHFE